MHSHIASEKPLVSINTEGKKQNTEQCKALLNKLPARYYPSGESNDQWKRVSKYGTEPMIFRVFKNAEGIYAKVVETPHQLAVVGIDIQEDLAKSIPITKQLEEYLQKPIQKEIKTSPSLEAAFDDVENESMQWIFTHVHPYKHDEYSNTLNTMLSKGATYQEILQTYGEWIEMLKKQHYAPPVEHTHFMFNQLLMLPTAINDDGSVHITLQTKNKKIPPGEFFDLPLQFMLEHISNSNHEHLQWRVSKSDNGFTVDIDENTMLKKSTTVADANYKSAYLLFKLAQAGLGLADKPSGTTMDDRLVECVRAAARMSATMRNSHAQPSNAQTQHNDNAGWSQEFTSTVRSIVNAQQSAIAPATWKNILHIEDSITDDEIQEFQQEFREQWEQHCQSTGDSGSYAFNEMLIQYGLNRNDMQGDREYLLRRKAIAGLFTLNGLFDSNGEPDSEDNEFDADDVIGGWFEDNTHQIESDEPHWLEYMFSSAIEDINESSQLILHGDPTVNDMDAIVTPRIKLYVWAIERGFRVDNAPDETLALVEQRKKMRAHERAMQGNDVGIEP